MAVGLIISINCCIFSLVGLYIAKQFSLDPMDENATSHTTNLFNYAVIGLIVCVILYLVYSLVANFSERFENQTSTFYLAKSSIHGNGVFTKESQPSNKILFEAIDNKNNVIGFGAFINHSNTPNTQLEKIGNSWYLKTLCSITKFTELVADYNLTPPFISKPNPNW